mgnify:CR=1
MGAWIEIVNCDTIDLYVCVAPLVGAWIEMNQPTPIPKPIAVAPLVGAWIEIHLYMTYNLYIIVAPLVGAWIEIRQFREDKGLKQSLPSWERGLKLHSRHNLKVKLRRSPRGSVD